MNRRAMLRSSAMTCGALALSRVAVAATQQGSDAYLAANENPYGPSPKALRAIQDSARLGNRYPRQAATNLLKEAIARRERLTPAHVVLGAGSSEVLAMAAIAYFARGGELVMPDPTFMALPRYAEKLGGSVKKVPLDGTFQHDLGSMQSAVSPETHLVYVCNPNNPTGSITPAARLREF